MKNKVLNFIFIFLSFRLLCSCGTVGKKFTGDIKDIKINITTRKEVENNFGFPYKAGLDSGLKVYNYLYVQVNSFTNSQIKELKVLFNENDTVHGYSFYSSFKDDQKIIFE